VDYVAYLTNAVYFAIKQEKVLKKDGMAHPAAGKQYTKTSDIFIKPAAPA
jgi:hypothetical protein